ncbi:MAG TPA: hypothetical protein VFK05_35095 [Polyangiaceae bacterium]|nr:hypothetical protein [Polyangiaceae bacterium]
MITVELKGAEKMVGDLAQMREKAVPYAIKNALNTAAFETRSIWQREIKSAFVNRNAFTQRSIFVEQATTAKLEARVGSQAPYMAVQETGGTVTGRSGRKPIPGPVAAGQAPGSHRTRLVRARFRLGAIQVAHPALSGDRKRRNAIAISTARKQGKSLVLLTRPNGGKGLFVIGAGKTFAPRFLWNVSRSSVHVRAEPTLERSLAAVKPKLDHMMEASLNEQMQRFNIGK